MPVTKAQQKRGGAFSSARASVTCLPAEIWDHVAAALAKYEDGSLWRTRADVVRDYCAVASASGALLPLQRSLRAHVVRILGSDRTRPQPRLSSAALKDDMQDIDETSKIAELQSVCVAWGIAKSGKKADVLARLRAHVVAAQRREDQSRIDLNPVPETKRRDWWYAMHARMAATNAKKAYKLRDCDLEGLPYKLREYRWAMGHMYLVTDLRRACLARFGSVENFVLGKQGLQRVARQAALDAVNDEQRFDCIDADAWAYTREHFTGTTTAAAIRRAFHAYRAILALPADDRELLEKWGPKAPPPTARLESTLEALRDRVERCQPLLAWNVKGLEAYIKSGKEDPHVISVLQRYQNLREATDTLGCEARTDSSLCRAYLFGHSHRSPDSIAKVMQEMQWLYAHPQLGYANLQDHHFEELLDAARGYEERQWVEEEDMRHIGHQAHELAKRDLAERLCRNGVPDALKPVPLLMQDRMQGNRNKSRR